MRRNLSLLFFFLIPVLGSSAIVEFSWPSTASSYRIQISTNNQFNNPFIDDLISATNYVTDLPPGSYFSRIAPVVREIEGRFTRLVEVVVHSDIPGKTNNITTINPLEAAAPVENETSPYVWNWKISNNSPIAGNSVIRYTLDNNENYKETASGKLEIEPSMLPEGSHTITYYAVNPLGIESPKKSFRFNVDRTPPQIKIQADKYQKIGGRTYLYPEASVRLFTSDSKGPFFHYFWVNYRLITNDIYLPEPETSIVLAKAFARDDAGLETVAYETFYIDRQAPSLDGYCKGMALTTNKIYGPEDEIVIRAMDNIRLGKVTVIIDNKPYPAVQPLLLSVLSEGEHNLHTEASDLFGNKTTKDWIIYVDKTPPESKIRIYPDRNTGN